MASCWRLVLCVSAYWFLLGSVSIVRELTCQSSLQAGSFYEEMQALTALTLQEIKTHLRCNVRASEIALAWSFPSCERQDAALRWGPNNYQ